MFRSFKSRGASGTFPKGTRPDKAIITYVMGYNISTSYGN